MGGRGHMQFVSIDFETANEKRFSPCAIGVVIANENDIEEEYYHLINPMTTFSPFNTRIHGITEADIEDALTYAELWPTLNEYMNHKLVVAHNASFDMSVMRHTLDYFQLPYPELDYLCTVNISKQVWPDLINHKLNTLAAYHHISFEHHQALEDARVAAKVFQKAIHSTGAESVEQLLSKLNMTKGHIDSHGYIPPRTKRRKKRKTLYF